MTRHRANGEGSIFPYRNGYAAYVWVAKPDGTRDRKYVYGQTREIVHDKWIKLQAEAKKGPVATALPTVAEYLAYWLAEIVKPDLAPLTYVSYEAITRLYVVPGLGRKKIDKLSTRDVRSWLNILRDSCQCCAQAKDAKRPPEHKNAAKRQRCCAIGQCCQDLPSRRTVQAARDALRAALSHAVLEELIAKNVAGLVKVPGPKKQLRRPWSVEEGRRFLEDARSRNDPLYAAWVLVLVLGLRRGEVLGLTWTDVNLDAGELWISKQIQRASKELLHRETKTDGSATVLPLPDICVTALRLRQKEQIVARATAGEVWQDTDLVFTTAYGTPIEPGNFTRMFAGRCVKASVPSIRLHDTRHTCASLLAAMDVHPRVAMQILRHSQIAITMEVYTHVPNEQTRAALKRLGDSLGSNGDTHGE